jgi:hypothetical protein
MICSKSKFNGGRIDKYDCGRLSIREHSNLEVPYLLCDDLSTVIIRVDTREDGYAFSTTTL